MVVDATLDAEEYVAVADDVAAVDVELDAPEHTLFVETMVQ